MFGLLTPSIASTPPKPGQTCSKAGTLKKFADVKYKCVREGKKLVWNNGVIQKSTKSTVNLNATSSISPSPMPSPSSGSSSTNEKDSKPPKLTLRTVQTSGGSANQIESGANPSFQDVKFTLTGQTTAEFSFRATAFQSYKVYVVRVSDPEGTELASTQIVNDKSSIVIVDVADLECDRANYYYFRARIFSGPDGEGGGTIGGIKVAFTSACSQEDLLGKPCMVRGEERMTFYFWICAEGDDGALVWFRKGFEPKSASQPSPKATSAVAIKQKVSQVKYAPPSSPSEDISNCKIKQVNPVGPRSGFPAPEPLYASTGKIRWALVPIDFADLPGQGNFLSRVQDEMLLASQWANLVSEGKLTIEWQVHPKWIRLPGESTSYKVPVMDQNDFRQPEQVSFWQRAITEADKYVDFTGVQAVHFILPIGQNLARDGVKGASWHDSVKNFVTNEGSRFGFFTIPGVYQDQVSIGRTYWSYWLSVYVGGLNLAKFGGSKIAPPLHTFIFPTAEGERELAGWSRFLLGWLPEERIYCRRASSIDKLELTLIPLSNNTSQGIKMAVIPLSDTKALILESRRVTKFSCTTFTERNGVLAYVYDARFGHTEDFFTAVSPPGRPIESYNCGVSPGSDPLLHEGDEIKIEGLSIKLLLHGAFDKVQVTRD